jgi:hypothetical protein
MRTNTLCGTVPKANVASTFLAMVFYREDTERLSQIGGVKSQIWRVQKSRYVFYFYMRSVKIFVLENFNPSKYSWLFVIAHVDQNLIVSNKITPTKSFHFDFPKPASACFRGRPSSSVIGNQSNISTCTSDATRFDDQADAPVQYRAHRPMEGVPWLTWKPLDTATGWVFTSYCPSGHQGNSKQNNNQKRYHNC